MRHERIKVKRDTNTMHNLTLAPWEIPIIEYLFDEGNVERVGQFVTVDREYPDAREELLRLEKVYGIDTESKIPHVVSVYGTARTGVRVLAKAIEAAREEEDEGEDEEPPPPPSPPARKPGRPPKQPPRAAADPLLT